MARDQTRRPVTDETLENVRKAMRNQREELREYLAERGVDVSSWRDTE